MSGLLQEQAIEGLGAYGCLWQSILKHWRGLRSWGWDFRLADQGS